VNESLKYSSIPLTKIEYFRIETLFARFISEYKGFAEWSIKYGEVVGDPECLQFDIDTLRDKAIQAYMDRYC
jgi:hypothetical protein